LKIIESPSCKKTISDTTTKNGEKNIKTKREKTISNNLLKK